MCLAVPGRVIAIYEKDDLPMGKVDFGGLSKEICLAYTPEARPGDYVLVHVGFAINTVDEAEAKAVFSLLEQLAESTGEKFTEL